MVTHQKEDYYKFGIWYLDLAHKLRPGDNCQGWSPTIHKGWSPTNLKMVTHQKEVCYRLGIWRLDLNEKTKTR